MSLFKLSAQKFLIITETDKHLKFQPNLASMEQVTHRMAWFMGSSIKTGHLVESDIPGDTQANI